MTEPSETRIDYEHQDPANSASESSHPNGPRRNRFWFGLRILEVRLRFIAVLVVLGLIIGYWEMLQNYWDRWTRPVVASSSIVASDTEFYCPMDPSVIRDGLEPDGSIPKCPICGMPLSLRKKGQSVELPPGVVGRVSIGPEQVQMAGIRTAEIGIRPMVRSVRTVGEVAYNEEMQYQIVTRIGGYLEKLMVNRSFIPVRQHEPLAEIYSPELYAAVQELKVAERISGSPLAQLARDKIRLLGIEEKDIEALLSDSATRYRVVIRSPADGYVIQKLVQQGASVSPGDMLFEVADIRSVWIEADVYERDIALLQIGQNVTATVDAYPNRPFQGTLALVYPQLNAATRTVKVRFEIDNSDQLLKTGMFATVTFETPIQHTEPFKSILLAARKPPADVAAAIARQAICPVTRANLGSMGDPVEASANGQIIYVCCTGCKTAIDKRPDYYLARIRTVTDDGVLAVPETAVINTGIQTLVYVEREDGIFEGLEVQLGPRVGGYYSVVSGLMPGDRVAAAGAFLIDAETRLNPGASAAYFGASSGPTRGAAPTTIQPPSSDAAESDLIRPGAKGHQATTANASTYQFTDQELENIAKLDPDRQSLAKAQVWCPVSEMPLGSMGPPFRVDVTGESVVVCCEGCQEPALRNADETLAKIREWKRQTRQNSPNEP
jgi:Cu(I)/Ag(I) efflux system membrane fusion protein